MSSKPIRCSVRLSPYLFALLGHHHREALFILDPLHLAFEAQEFTFLTFGAPKLLVGRQAA